MTRTRFLPLAHRLALAALAAGVLAGCAAPLPPVRLVRLPVDPPGVAPGVAGPGSVTVPGGVAAASDAALRSAPGASVEESWRLQTPGLPGHLDRDALLVPDGGAGLRALDAVRWAEPLRDAVPRLLRHDLGRVLGITVWPEAAPPGAMPTRRLWVELLAFDVAPGGRGVQVHARWRLSSAAPDSRAAAVAGPQAMPRSGEAVFVAPVDGDGSADALALAHRRAIAELAARIAASVRP
jgi:uncharacterized lipoprotein YmbA